MLNGMQDTAVRKRSPRKETPQRRMYEALPVCFGVVKHACLKAGVSRQTHYTWMKEDANYRKRVESLANEHQAAFNKQVSANLRKSIRSGEGKMTKLVENLWGAEICARVKGGEDYIFNLI